MVVGRVCNSIVFRGGVRVWVLFENSFLLQRVASLQPSDNHTAFYDQWAATNRFLVGDSLRFEYKNDSVLVVDKCGYFHCNISNPISIFNNGNNTVVSLDKPGPMYFVSGDPDHCKNGQRLVIQVMTCMHKSATTTATSLTVSGLFKSSRRRAPQRPSSLDTDEFLNLLHGSDPVKVELNRLENEVRDEE
ncbi:Early nodulin-like protein 2 [Camellia lanceoleosa]|uniref:Early nodulin-like protein 2 n=1 Tax=Camellia lanceoleosa TaxID=1840588 RepID=A0ACC0HNT4_9ERIC|nr:Early nodulin-like protein 2 [Camellia lanceoleosa]